MIHVPGYFVHFTLNSLADGGHASLTWQREVSYKATKIFVQDQIPATDELICLLFAQRNAFLVYQRQDPLI